MLVERVGLVKRLFFYFVVVFVLVVIATTLSRRYVLDKKQSVEQTWSPLILHIDEYNIDVSVYFARNHDFKELPAKARAHLAFISNSPVAWRDISPEGQNEVAVTANFVRSVNPWSIGEIAFDCPENAHCQSLQPEHYGAIKIAGATALITGNPSFPKGYQIKDNDARSDVLYDVTWSGRFPFKPSFYFAESLPPERGLSRSERNFVVRALEKILTVQE